MASPIALKELLYTGRTFIIVVLLSGIVLSSSRSTVARDTTLLYCTTVLQYGNSSLGQYRTVIPTLYSTLLRQISCVMDSQPTKVGCVWNPAMQLRDELKLSRFRTSSFRVMTAWKTKTLKSLLVLVCVGHSSLHRRRSPHCHPPCHWDFKKGLSGLEFFGI